MAVVIRLRRMGAKKDPKFRIVVAESKSPRDGRFIEELGHYNPQPKAADLGVNAERAQYWLSVGATPSDELGDGLSPGRLWRQAGRIHGPCSAAVLARRVSRSRTRSGPAGGRRRRIHLRRRWSRR